MNEEGKKLMHKVLSKMVYFPLDEVYVLHDISQIPWIVFSVSIMPDASVRYTLRSGDAFMEVTPNELLREPNPRFIHETEGE
jgi:hypothetical protein